MEWLVEFISMKTLSIIICTYNRNSLLLKCLQELIQQITEIGDPRVDVVVVDNNSSDGTDRVTGDLAHQYGWLNYVKEAKQGLSHARNCGATSAQGAYLCYLDDDGCPGPKYLKSVLRVIDEHQPDVFGGPVYPFYTSKKPFWFQDALEKRCHADSSGFADCLISGGNYIIRADLLKQIGMFSPDYGMVGTTLSLGDDRELLERYKRSLPREQQRIYYSLECFIYHHVPAYKMSLTYFVKRAYQSGKMSVRIKKETMINAPTLVRVVTKGMLARLWVRFISGRSDVHIFLRILHRFAMLAGMSMQHLKNIAGDNKHTKSRA